MAQYPIHLPMNVNVFVQICQNKISKKKDKKFKFNVPSKPVEHQDDRKQRQFSLLDSI
jgi:hypothetical protein